MVLDVDGVLTDGGVYIGCGERGESVELKRFDIQDGLGIKLLQWSGIRVVMVSGRVSSATTVRAEELEVEVHQISGAHKVPCVADLLAEGSMEWEEVAMVGDDLPDLPLFRKVGLPVAVANAVPEIRDAALCRTASRGGRGAVREFARALLVARGEWSQRVEEYCDARTGD